MLGVCNVCSFVPTILRVFLLKNVESLHRDAVSDIPGNPHAFSNAIISLFRTLPEPSNFNIVWTGLSLKEPLLIRGRIPLSRFSSMSVYGAGSSDPPNSIELIADGNARTCEVVLTSDVDADIDEKPNRIVLRTNGWAKGFISMRNYLVPPGTSVVTPEIVRLRDGKVVRSSNALVAGPCGLDMRASKWAMSALRILAVNLIFLGINTILLRGILSTHHIVVIIISSGLLGLLIYHLCFILGRKRLQQLTSDICHGINNFYYASLEQGSKASQPSKLHKYWIMCHDVPPGQEIKVTARIDPCKQKYWSLVVYDAFGLPLPQYVYDDNAFKVPDVGPSSVSSRTRTHDHSHPHSQEVYKVDIRLRHGPARPEDDVNANILDISVAPKGYVLFRVNHPVDESVVEFSSPETFLQDVESKKKL